MATKTGVYQIYESIVIEFFLRLEGDLSPLIWYE